MRVCVYASSSPKTSPAFVAQGRRLGRLLAERGHVLINGGGKFGGMGALNEGCRAAGGVIECVIHEMFVVDEGEFEGSDHLIVCQGTLIMIIPVCMSVLDVKTLSLRDVP